LSKRFKGKTCVYCVTPNSSVAPDHVLAREFCLVDKRSGIPKVPACAECNKKKSDLEHYVTAVAPFGARHADSTENLTTMVPGRLAKNRPLHRQLEQGLSWHFESRDGLTWVQTLAVPFDARKLLRLYEYMAQGLAHWHWGVYLPRDTCEIYAGFVIPQVEALFDRMLTVAVAHKVTENLSEGVLLYTGIQDPNHPQLTVWRISLYDGATFGSDPHNPPHTPSRAYVVSGPKSLAAVANIVRTLQR
jgi:hypothetical protein